MLEPGRLEFWIGFPKVVAFVGCFLADFAGQKPAAKRSVSENGKTIHLGVGKDVLFDSPFKKIVRRLDACQRRRRLEPIHLGGREIADADRPDFSLFLEAREGAAVSSMGTPPSGQCT